MTIRLKFTSCVAVLTLLPTLQDSEGAFFDCWVALHGEQTVVCGLLLITMAVGNFSNTVATLITKAKFKAKMRKKGQEVLQLMTSKKLS
jgi:hypothetical protein